MVGRTLAFGLQQQRHFDQVFAIPGCERLQGLQTVGFGTDHHSGFLTCRGYITVVFHFEPFRRKVGAFRFFQFHFAAVGGFQCIGQRIEAEVSGDGQRQREFRGGDKSMCVRIAVRPFGEITVKGGDDGVFARIVVGMPFPLPDTRTAGVSHNCCTDLLEIAENTITFSRIADLLGTGVDNQRGFHRNLVFGSLAGDRGGTAQILVGRVRAGTDQSDFHLTRPAVLLHFGGKFGDRRGGIRCERAVDMRFQFGQVDDDHTVVERIRLCPYVHIGFQIVG